MPELPDVVAYLEAIERRIAGRVLERIRLASPSVRRTVDPRPAKMEGRRVVALSRIGKRIAIELEEERFIVVHLMGTGRFRWLAAATKVPGQIASRRSASTTARSRSPRRGQCGEHRSTCCAAVKSAAQLDCGGIDAMAADPRTCITAW